jgi:acid phosphatase (class A)
MNPVRKSAFRGILLVLACVAITVGCASVETQSGPAAVKEIRPGILEGYLAAEELPDSLALLPPPPAEGSAAFARDEEANREGLALRDTPRWELAIKDAVLHFPAAADAFSDAVGFRITETSTPYLYQLLRRTLADAGLSTYAAKNHYSRARPFTVNNEPICTPEDEEDLRKDGSYPSGHTAIGWAWALILCEIVPERTDDILARGHDYGQSRVVCNVHWQSDVDQGRVMAAATVARLHADEGFRRDLELAKQEVASIRSRKD